MVVKDRSEGCLFGNPLHKPAIVGYLWDQKIKNTSIIQESAGDPAQRLAQIVADL